MISNTLAGRTPLPPRVFNKKKGRGSLMGLREAYRTQHEVMVGQGKVYNTTRRQTNFRPRGNVYTRLLKLEMK